MFEMSFYSIWTSEIGFFGIFKIKRKRFYSSKTIMINVKKDLERSYIEMYKR